MINYFKELKTQIEETNNQIKSETDEYKKIMLQFNLRKLNDTAKNFYHVIIKSFDKERIKTISLEKFGQETINNAEKEAALANNRILSMLVEQSYAPLEKKEDELNTIIKENPDIENEDFANNELKVVYKALKRDINSINIHIDEVKSRLFVFYDKLSDENKDVLTEELINNLDKNIYDNVFDQIKNYKSALDFDRNQINMVQDKFDAFTSNEAEDQELAKYLLDNKDAINRLSIKQDNDILVSINSATVFQLSHQYGVDRHKDFTISAKENNVEDICDTQGQFISKKIYFNKEDYNRYSNCIKDLHVSDENKEKFKMLLKEMEKLNILDEKSFAEESSQKEYGFFRLLNAKQKFFDEMNKEKPSKEDIQNALEDLKSEEEKIRKMYKLIEKTLGDDFKTMPGNVDSIRNVWVPSEFKENLVVNSKFNSLYIMLTFIKEKGLSIDEFVDNPLKVSDDEHQKEVDKRNLNKVLKGKSKAEALLYLADESKGLKEEEPYKYTRNMELLSLANENEKEYRDNTFSVAALTTKHGVLSRVMGLKNTFFNMHYKDSLQNIFLAKENDDHEIPYLDCHISANSIKDHVDTGLVADDLLSVLQQIAKDDDIVNTFYNTIDTIKEYIEKEKDIKEENRVIKREKVFAAFQEFAAKIAITLDLKDKDKYPQQFVNDINNAINNYKAIDAFKNIDIVLLDDGALEKLKTLIARKDEAPKIQENSIKRHQKEYDDKFIEDFKTINKEIDKLDAKVTKIEKRLKKGETNKEIDDITIEVLQKNNEIRELQNKRLKQLRNDLENGAISKLYFERKVEQVMFLKDLNVQPPLFICDDKNYKDFKTYKKNILKDSVLTMTADEINQARIDYADLMSNSKEEKRLFLLNKILEQNKLGVPKTENGRYIDDIKIVDNTLEYQTIVDERNEIEEVNKQAIEVDLNDNLLIYEDNEIKEEAIDKKLDVQK